MTRWQKCMFISSLLLLLCSCIFTDIICTMYVCPYLVFNSYVDVNNFILWSVTVRKTLNSNDSEVAYYND